MVLNRLIQGFGDELAAVIHLYSFGKRLLERPALLQGIHPRLPLSGTDRRQYEGTYGCN